MRNKHKRFREFFKITPETIERIKLFYPDAIEIFQSKSDPDYVCFRYKHGESIFYRNDGSKFTTSITSLEKIHIFEITYIIDSMAGQ